MPKISVIIPVYNGEEYLIECLDSVVNQTLKEIEIICVDDGSTDKSLEILNEYRMKDSRIKILTQENSGAGVARNNAIQIANGEYVAFLDSDDLYPNIDTLSQLYKQALIHKVKICGGSANILTKKEILKNTIENYQFLKDEIMQYKDYQYDYGYWRFIYDRKFLIENNIAFPNYLRGQDPPFFIKAMTLAQEFYAMKMPTYIYRMSHKGILWTEKKAVDILCSYRDCLGIAKQYQLDKLYNRVIDRINRPYIKNAIIKYIDKPTLTNVIKEITRIEPERLDSIYYFEYKCNISIIISVYNVERYLRECLDSIVNQTLQDIEIICVDDGSTDKSSEILKEFAAKDSRIRVISQENQGLACSRNNAMKIAKGKYILFVDSDDYIRKDTLEMLYNYAEVNNLEMLSFGGTNFDNETRIDLGNPYYEFRYLPENFNIKCFNYKDCTDFITSMAVSSCLTMYKNLFIIHNNILFPSHLCFEDNVFFCKALMNANRCGILKDVLYFRRVHDQSITQNFEKHYLDYIKISDIVLSYLNEMKISEKIYKQYKNAYITKCISLYNKYSEKSQKLYYKELKKLVKKYDKKLLKLIKKPLSITQKVFSITNKPSDNGKWHKVITILGIKFSFRNKKKEEKFRQEQLYKNVNSCLQKIEDCQKSVNNSMNRVDTINQGYINILNSINSLQKQFDCEIKKSQNTIKNLENKYNSAVNKLTPQKSLRSFAYHLADHCNLQCQNCDHFSPVAEKKLASIESYEKDIKRLSELCNKKLEIIKLMGGEPLLHPDIIKFMQISRQYFPDTRIEIVTNGILLNQQNEDFWHACQKLDITIVPTKYPINVDYDKAKETAINHDVKYEYFNNNENVVKTSYHIPLDIEGKQNCGENFINCFHANWCVMLKDGRLYTCTIAPNIEHFNRYFGQNIPLTDKDSIDIHKANSIEEILEFIARPIPFCKYCKVSARTFQHQWGTSKKDIKEWT